MTYPSSMNPWVRHDHTSSSCVGLRLKLESRSKNYSHGECTNGSDQVLTVTPLIQAIYLALVGMFVLAPTKLVGHVFPGAMPVQVRVLSLLFFCFLLL